MTFDEKIGKPNIDVRFFLFALWIEQKKAAARRQRPDKIIIFVAASKS
jgi:hypothetical protein